MYHCEYDFETYGKTVHKELDGDLNTLLGDIFESRNRIKNLDLHKQFPIIDGKEIKPDYTTHEFVLCTHNYVVLPFEPKAEYLYWLEIIHHISDKPDVYEFFQPCKIGENYIKFKHPQPYGRTILNIKK